MNSLHFTSFYFTRS